jgi:membrane-associated PAP2 superfamily phosphatase
VAGISSPQNADVASAPKKLASGIRSRVSRIAITLILAVGAITGLVFGLYPQLDLSISALFYDPLRHTWPATNNALLALHRDFSAYVAAILVIIAIILGAVGTICRREPWLRWPRAAGFLIGSCLLGPGLIVNTLLKPEWGRPRPADVLTFGGRLPFVPWWNPFGACDGNCSFVSGETSLAFWVLAWALVLPRRYRAATATAALVNCLVLSAGRIAMGGHFTSDVLFAVIVTALAIWLSYIIAFGEFAFMRHRSAQHPVNGGIGPRGPLSRKP